MTLVRQSLACCLRNSLSVWQTVSIWRSKAVMKPSEMALQTTSCLSGFDLLLSHELTQLVLKGHRDLANRVEARLPWPKANFSPFKKSLTTMPLTLRLSPLSPSFLRPRRECQLVEEEEPNLIISLVKVSCSWLAVALAIATHNLQLLVAETLNELFGVKLEKQAS